MSDVSYKCALVIDDESMVRNLIKLTLIEVGFDVFDVECAEDAIKVWLDHSAEICLIITDVSLPRMSGPEFIEEIHPDPSRVKVIFVTGGEEINIKRFPNAASMLKPFGLNELKSHVSAFAH